MSATQLREALLDPSRLISVALIAAVLVALDYTVLEFIGIQTVTEAVVQFVVITVGAVVALSVLDVFVGLPDQE